MKSFLLVAVAFVAGAAAMFFWKQRTPPPRKELSGLREQLDQAAQRNLPLPTLETPPLATPTP